MPPSSLLQPSPFSMLNKLENLIPSNNGRRISVPHSKLEKNHTEDLFSREILRRSKHTTLIAPRPTRPESTNSPFSLKKSSDLDSSLKWSSQPTFKPQKTSKPTQLPPLTGPLKEKSPESKTKDNVDHAGHSQPQVLLNHGLFSRDNHGTSQNNNSSTVQLHMETTDATVDGHQALLTTLEITDLPLKLFTHMPPETKTVPELEETSTSQAFYQFQVALDYQLELLPDHSQSPLMLQTGQTITQVSSTTVEAALTTPSSWSELMLQVSGKSRTHGEPHGVKEDTSD